MPGVDIGSVPTKRQSLIPFPRVGKRDSISSRLSVSSYDWPKRDDFKRRITRRSYWDQNSRAFSRRILRSEDDGDSFERRITRSWDQVTPAPGHLLHKRQSLIPFPRTGKRSDGPNKEENQVYVFESPEDEEDGDIGSVFAEADIDVDFDEDFDQLEGMEDVESEEPEIGRVARTEHTAALLTAVCTYSPTLQVGAEHEHKVVPCNRSFYQSYISDIF